MPESLRFASAVLLPPAFTCFLNLESIYLKDLVLISPRVAREPLNRLARSCLETTGSARLLSMRRGRTFRRDDGVVALIIPDETAASGVRATDHRS
jgi:hypothetical protein